MFRYDSDEQLVTAANHHLDTGKPPFGGQEVPPDLTPSFWGVERGPMPLFFYGCSEPEVMAWLEFFEAW